MLDPDRRDDIDRLRSALDAHGYARPESAEALGLADGSEPRRIDRPLYLKRLDRDSPLHTLIRLFALHTPVAEAEAQEALLPLGLPEAAALGLVERCQGLVVPQVGFVVIDGLVLARDLPAGDSPELRADHVLGLNVPALMLARLTVREPVGAALDIGCGGGVQSLLAARHAERVTGVDLNPRAVAFARFNARLNGITNVDFREGSLFEPVAGERFDLVVCNPPYVISPDAELLFRDGGRPGDSFCEEVVRGAAAHLAPGGFATALVNWVVPEHEPWSQPLERWAAGQGVDACLLRIETSDALGYAASWVRHPDAARYAKALDRWVAYYAARSIQSIGMGAVVLRKRASGTPWVSAVDLPVRPPSQAGPEVLQFFAAQDRLSQLQGREAMLAARFRAADALRVTQVASLQEGRFTPGVTELSLDGPLPFEGRADAGALRLIQLADGSRTLGEIVAAIANGRELASERLEASLVEAARRLVTFGFMVTASEAGGGTMALSAGGSPRRTLLRRAAWAAGGVIGLVAGRRASARDERLTPGPVSVPGGRELRYFGRGPALGAPGPNPGAAWVVRRCKLLEQIGGPSIGEFVATALAGAPSFGALAGAAAPLEMQTFQLGNDAFFGIGAGAARGDRTYAVIGGTGRFAGARGTAVERETGGGSAGRHVEFLVTLVG